MKQKGSLLMAVLLAISVLFSTVQTYADSPSNEEAEIRDAAVPLVEMPEVRVAVNNDKADNQHVSGEALIEAAREVENGNAVRIVVSMPNEGESVFPKAGVDAVIAADADVMVSAPSGRAVMASSILEAFDGDIGFHIVKNSSVSGEGIMVYISCNGKISYTWNGRPIVLYVPAINGAYEEGNSYSVNHYNENGDLIGAYVGQCVEEDGQLWVVITVDSNYLALFVAQPDAMTADLAHASDPVVVASPLVTRAAIETATPNLLTAVQHWFDSIANHVLALFGL